MPAGRLRRPARPRARAHPHLDGAAARTLVHDDLVGDAGAQLGHVADDADGAAALAQPVEHGQHLLEAVVVEAAEALVDEQRAEVEAAGLLAHGVGQPEGQGQRGHEGLAAGQRGGVARPDRSTGRAPAGPGRSGRRGRRARRSARAGSGRRPSTASRSLASVGHRLEPGREHVGRQPHPQGVVGAGAARGVGELAHPGVALRRRAATRAQASSTRGSSRSSDAQRPGGVVLGGRRGQQGVARRPVGGLQGGEVGRRRRPVPRRRRGPRPPRAPPRCPRRGPSRRPAAAPARPGHAGLRVPSRRRRSRRSPARRRGRWSPRPAGPAHRRGR